MLTYKLIENSNGYVSYAYHPEGRDDIGTVIVNKNDLEDVKFNIAPTDSFRRYMLKMYKSMRSFIENNSFPQDGIIAWY